MRVLHSPNNEANNPYGLSFAEKMLGVNSRLEILRSDGYFDSADRNWAKRSLVAREIMRWPLILYALCRFDVIHYNNGSFLSPMPIPEMGRWLFLKKLYNVLYGRIFQGVDIKLFSLAGKKIAVTFQGSDARIIGFCKQRYRWHFCDEAGFYHSEAGDADRLARIGIFDRYADNIYSVNPDIMHNLPERTVFTPYASVFPESIEAAENTSSHGPLKVVHAPSNRGVKGTRYVLEAVEALKAQGVALELVLVEGLTNAEAMQRYREADLVVDQLLAGWYGAFAVEAMAMGKPVICYIREEDMGFLPDGMNQDLPIINANPDTILSVLAGCCAQGRKQLGEVGKRSRKYVEKWHDPYKIAQMLIERY